MRRRSDQQRRSGAVVVEAAVILPVMFLLLIFLVLGGVGVFHQQQVTNLAREATRWLAVRGSESRNETGAKAATEEDLRNQVILPLASSIDPSQLSVETLWIDGATGKATRWDASPRSTRSLDPVSSQWIMHRVRVTVTYDWLGDGRFIGPIRLQSTSEFPMLY